MGQKAQIVLLLLMMMMMSTLELLGVCCKTTVCVCVCVCEREREREISYNSVTVAENIFSEFSIGGPY
jgi:hypothetical protein